MRDVSLNSGRTGRKNRLFQHGRRTKHRDHLPAPRTLHSNFFSGMALVQSVKERREVITAHDDVPSHLLGVLKDYSMRQIG